MKTINIAKTTNSPRGIKKQNETELQAVEKVLNKISFKNAMIVIEKRKNLYACKVPMENLLNGLCVSGQRVKILCPFGRKQIDELIDNGSLEKIGVSADLQKYYISDYYKVKNDGQAIEYYLKQLKKQKFNHNEGMTSGNGEFLGCEVKFFSFDKTSGTPSATFESLKSINR